MITTRTGDGGYTQVRFGRTVRKSHPMVAAVGAVDMLTTALGAARADLPDGYIRGLLSGVRPSLRPHAAFMGGAASMTRAVQVRLVALMGELATMPEDWHRLLEEREAGQRDSTVRAGDLAYLDWAIGAMDGHIDKEQRDWAIPGDHPGVVAWETARAKCREAERLVVILADHWEQEAVGRRVQGLVFDDTFKYLNRLSDALWMIARVAERGRGGPDLNPPERQPPDE